MPVAQELLLTQGLELQGSSLKQGAAGTMYFEPGGVSFCDRQRPNRRRWLASLSCRFEK
jgi:hypothetical protein